MTWWHEFGFAVGPVLLVLVAAELAFYLYIKLVVYPRISPVRKAPKPAMDPTIFIERVLQHIICLEKYNNTDFFAGMITFAGNVLAYRIATIIIAVRFLPRS